ncbi:MAG TPA: hypothetical protein VKB34_03615 [Povalibacter sp.]|nr:hypothetical protein [Povalibacter sp.]
MDEYLFILVAKLKADRLRLQREEQGVVAVREREELPRHQSPKARRSASVSGDWSSVVSTHGLRGWS